MKEPINRAIILPGTTAPVPKVKSLEEQVAEQLGQEKGQAGIAICKRLATEPRSIGSIGIEVFGLPDTEEGRCGEV